MAIKYKLRINGSGHVNEIIDCGTALQKSLTSLALNLGDAVEVASYDDDGNQSEWSAPVTVAAEGASGGGNGGNGSAASGSQLIECSSRFAPITATGEICTFPAPAMTNPKFVAYLTNPAAAGTFEIDIEINGDSICTSKIKIDAGEKTSVTAAAQAGFQAVETDPGDEIAVIVTNVADGSASGLWLVMTAAVAPPDNSNEEPPNEALEVPIGLTVTPNGADLIIDYGDDAPVIPVPTGLTVTPDGADLEINYA